jgi:hypothetical protein
MNDVVYRIRRISRTKTTAVPLNLIREPLEKGGVKEGEARGVWE